MSPRDGAHHARRPGKKRHGDPLRPLHPSPPRAAHFPHVCGGRRQILPFPTWAHFVRGVFDSPPSFPRCLPPHMDTSHALSSSFCWLSLSHSPHLPQTNKPHVPFFTGLCLFLFFHPPHSHTARQNHGTNGAHRRNARSIKDECHAVRARAAGGFSRSWGFPKTAWTGDSPRRHGSARARVASCAPKLKTDSTLCARACGGGILTVMGMSQDCRRRRVRL